MKNRDFLNLPKLFVSNFSMFCIYWKCLFSCSIRAQIPYLRKIWFLRYIPKCFQPIKWLDFQINRICRKKMIDWFFVCLYKFIKLKNWLKIFLVGDGQKWVWTLWLWQSKIGYILKLVSANFYQIFIFSPNDTPSKTIEIVFYII